MKLSLSRKLRRSSRRAFFSLNICCARGRSQTLEYQQPGGSSSLRHLFVLSCCHLVYSALPDANLVRLSEGDLDVARNHQFRRQISQFCANPIASSKCLAYSTCLSRRPCPSLSSMILAIFFGLQLWFLLSASPRSSLSLARPSCQISR